MNLVCPRCGEPWDNDTLHEEAAERGVTYQQIAREFRQGGCLTFENTHGPQAHCQLVINDTTVIAQVAYEINGDDMDGAMSDLDDYGPF